MPSHQPRASHFINGEYLEDTEGAAFGSISPATGDVIARLHEATPAIMNAAIASAKVAQKQWCEVPFAERLNVLAKVGILLRERNDELAELETYDTGKPISETLVADPASAAECFEFYAKAGSSDDGTYHPIEGGFVQVVREPLGICAGIGAWNYPIQIAGWKAAPALACGNAMIFKPSEVTPLSALKLAEIICEAGAPHGLFNVVQGAGFVGNRLASDPDIAKISLTGSVPTGKKVYAAAADTLKEVSLELGGKSPLIIFNDADIDKAVEGAINGNFYSSGQVCSNGTRIFVQRGVQAPFLEAFVERARAMKIGDPFDPTTEIGPLISKAHAASVLKHIERGVVEGAHPLLDGRHLPSDQTGSDIFVGPTIFSGVTDEMTIAQEEIFGPVASVLVFDDEEEVVERANASPLGLAAGIYTSSLDCAHKIAARIQAGICWINTYNEYPIAMPFGGYKQSGIGRENGLLALDYYSQTKSILVRFTADQDR